MASYDEYNKKFLKSSESSLNEGINTANQNAQKSKDIINTKYDGQKKTLQENYDTDVANTNESYENAFKQNEVQVKLNERYLERKAAEMGLTDSGMNRTQMTANQLSYANQKGELTRQRQKAIDTLAATMRAKMTELNSNQAADIAEVDMNLNSSIAQLKADNQKWASEQAADAVKAEQEAASKVAAAQQDEFASLWKVLKDENDNRSSDKDYLMGLIWEYCKKYDIDVTGIHMAMLLSAADVTFDDFDEYKKSKLTVRNESAFRAYRHSIAAPFFQSSTKQGQKTTPNSNTKTTNSSGSTKDFLGGYY